MDEFRIGRWIVTIPGLLGSPTGVADLRGGAPNQELPQSASLLREEQHRASLLLAHTGQSKGVEDLQTEPPAMFKYRAFISYSHVDEGWGRRLHKWIESYRVPKALVGRSGRDGPAPRQTLRFSC